MLEISDFKSFTGHFFQSEEDCLTWENRDMAMQTKVIENFKKEIIAIDHASLPDEILKAISDREEKDYAIYPQALAKTAYLFNHIGLNNGMSFACCEGKERRKMAEELNRKVIE